MVMILEKFYKKGAEAELIETIFEQKKALNKKRTQKNYRNFSLDLSIRKKRTRAETKLIKEASKVINVPQIFFVNENSSEIIMEFVEGVPVKEVIEKNKDLCLVMGQEIKKMHNLGVIHGDLTTSNLLYFLEKKGSKNKEKIFFIDFGLGYFSKKLEDKATDLIVFKKTFNATHSGIKKGWALVMKGYSPDVDLLKQMEKIEKRARYH